MPEMTIVKRDRRSAGSCNFCSGTCESCNSQESHKVVYEVTSPLPCGIQVRFCIKCLEKLKNEAK